MLPLEYILLSSEQAYLAAREGYVPVIPFGSVEQHCKGPLGTDSIIAETVARKACIIARRRGAGCILLPTVSYGFSPEWLGSPGTLSLPLETFTQIVRSLLDGLYNTGYRRILLVNGHGGNSGLLYSATIEWASSHRDAIVGVADYWRLAGIDIGHASRVEEKLLSDAGVEAGMGDCPEVKIGGPGRIVNPPPHPARLEPGNADTGISLDSVAASIAEFLTRIARVEPGVYSI